MRSDGPAAANDEDDEEKDPRNVVTLSTLHAAKGLEFPVVFVIGCVEGVLPHSRTTDPKASEATPADVEEERRLFYVGVTRARERLYLTRPKRRMMRGKVAPLTPSRFLDGLPADHIEEYIHVEKPPMPHEEIEAMTAALLAKLSAR
jgi:DNA helicase-2/ATP-dependent DNA helicase PcrA